MTHRYRKSSTTLETRGRSSGSLPQHFENILHKSAVKAGFLSPSGLRGRSPRRILDLNSVASILSHIKSAVNIWTGQVTVI